jgi:ABC-2 type transport system ATP-binding protein
VLGLDVATEGGAIRERVGYMPEHDCLPPDVSATEFVVHMARMSGLPATAARERTADTLRHVGLYEERYRPIGTYSTGMKQRVKLAQALVHDPQLVLLDEPTNGLDPVGRDDMLELIRRVHREFGISVLVTSHLLGELERTCDHVVVIDGGKLLRSSSTADLTAVTSLLAVEVTERQGDPSFDVDAALQARLREAGLTVVPDGGGHVQLVELTGDEVYDVIRDAVAELGVGLIRLEQRRHHISEVFAAGAPAQNAEEAAHV